MWKPPHLWSYWRNLQMWRKRGNRFKTLPHYREITEMLSQVQWCLWSHNLHCFRPLLRTLRLVLPCCQLHPSHSRGFQHLPGVSSALSIHSRRILFRLPSLPRPHLFRALYSWSHSVSPQTAGTQGCWPEVLAVIMQFSLVLFFL